MIFKQRLMKSLKSDALAAIQQSLQVQCNLGGLLTLCSDSKARLFFGASVLLGERDIADSHPPCPW